MNSYKSLELCVDAINRGNHHDALDNTNEESNDYNDGFSSLITILLQCLNQTSSKNDVVIAQLLNVLSKHNLIRKNDIASLLNIIITKELTSDWSTKEIFFKIVSRFYRNQTETTLSIFPLEIYFYLIGIIVIEKEDVNLLVLACKALKSIEQFIREREDCEYLDLFINSTAVNKAFSIATELRLDI